MIIGIIPVFYSQRLPEACCALPKWVDCNAIPSPWRPFASIGGDRHAVRKPRSLPPRNRRARNLHINVPEIFRRLMPRRFSTCIIVAGFRQRYSELIPEIIIAFIRDLQKFIAKIYRTIYNSFSPHWISQKKEIVKIKYGNVKFLVCIVYIIHLQDKSMILLYYFQINLVYYISNGIICDFSDEKWSIE